MTEATALPEQFHFTREEGKLEAAEYVALLRRTDLPRPVEDEARIGVMLSHSNLILTIRHEDGHLVGVSRCLTDFAWCCYLSDLCIEGEHQGSGLGQALLAETRRVLGPQVMLILLSVPNAMGWYPKRGMNTIANGFMLRRDS